MGSAIVSLDVSDERGGKCRVKFEWKGDQADLDDLVAKLDEMSYSKGIAPDQLAISTALGLPTLLKLRALTQFTDLQCYWVFSLCTNDAARPGSFFAYVAGSDFVIDVTVVGRRITVQSREAS